MMYFSLRDEKKGFDYFSLILFFITVCFFALLGKAMPIEGSPVSNKMLSLFIASAYPDERPSSTIFYDQSIYDSDVAGGNGAYILTSVPELEIISYDRQVMAGEEFHAEISVENMNYETHDLNLLLRNGANVAFYKTYSSDPGGSISIPVNLNTEADTDYFFLVTALPKDGGWNSPDRYSVRTASDIEIIRDVPLIRFEIISYDRQIMAGEEFHAQISIENMNYETHDLNLLLRNGANVAFYKTYSSDPGGSISIPAKPNTEAGTDYFFLVTALPKDGGWNSPDRYSVRTASDIEIIRDVPLIRFEILSYDRQIMAGEEFHAQISIENMNYETHDLNLLLRNGANVAFYKTYIQIRAN